MDELSIKIVQVTDGEADYNKKPTPKEIKHRKILSSLWSEAQRNAKLPCCMLCENECSSFCNSHSVPGFTLSRIAENGMVSESIQNKAPLHEKSLGIARTGTFKLICETCDNERFQDYENPYSYAKTPTNKMIAQIALKNFLLMIYKRREENELYTLLGKKYPHTKAYTDEKVYIGNLDLLEYLSGLKYAQKAIEKSNEKYYHLYYYKVLDYVVPYAAQSAITLISDFEDNVINNPYSLSPKTKMKYVHIAVFPLKSTSIIMLFVENGEKRYGSFFRQFRKLSDEDKLSAINFIAFSNIENVFLNPTLQKKMQENRQFVDVCGLTTDIKADISIELEPFPIDCPPEKMLLKAIEEFSLSKRHTIPNLLSREYAITNNTIDVKRC